jgi:hypothetical protein
VSKIPDDLPEYDDERHTDAHVIREYLTKRIPDRWGVMSVPDYNDAHSLQPEQVVKLGEYERVIITDVIGALLATGDATLVKNPTYRAMRRDGADVERLAAGLSKLGYTEVVVQADGNPVTAALTILEAVQRIAADAMNVIRGEVAL